MEKSGLYLYEPEAVAGASRTRTQREIRERTVWTIRGDIARVFKPGPTGRLQWRPLPRGAADVTTVRRAYAGLQREGWLEGFDQERLDKALSLNPDRWYVGSEGFDGYSIFTFGDTKKALMECPIYGNALFVIGSGWERWSRMTKQELRADKSGEVVRIEHRRDWFEKVKKELGTG